MNISINWLKKYIDLPETVTELEKLLTFAGIEVEAVRMMPALPETIISARVIKAEAVPKTDHLKSCLIDIGDYPYPEKTEDGYLQVICGAPNCYAGMMALIALPGTALPEFTISKAKIRGIESHGMLCSEKELGISENHAGIIELATETAIGVSANELYELPDTVFELEITPNRSDLLGYIGIARDLSAKLNRPVRLPELSVPEAGFPQDAQPLNMVNLDAELCPRYIARLFRNINLGDSPLWMKSALIKSGLRPINNLVDVTNYVMLEYGHPLHAFDYANLAPLPRESVPAIVIRKASPKEAFTALDGKSYSLDGDELVIADGIKPSALAGVMGGEISAINNATKTIVLESAAFKAGSIRKTSYKHKISTDSSYRFERHLSDHAASDASLRAAQLICELAQGEQCEVVYDNWPVQSKPLVLGIRPTRYEQVIGYPMEETKITDYLTKLGLKFLQYGDWKPGNITDLSEVFCHHSEEVKQGKEILTEAPDCVHTLYFEIPTNRVDLEREIDLIEELARLDGYDKVPVKTAPKQIMDRHAYRIKKLAADYIVNRGCYETLNYSFTEPSLMTKLGFEQNAPEMQMIKLVNPQSSTMSAMRTSLVPQLLQNMAYNLNHGEKSIKLFELGKVYVKNGNGHTEPTMLTAVISGFDREEHWQDKAKQVSGAMVKGMFEELLSLLNINKYSSALAKQPFLSPTESLVYTCNDVVLGYFGKLSASVAESYGIDLIELKQDIWLLHFEMENLIEQTRAKHIVFTPIPRHPGVNRDLSFLIANSVNYSEIEACIMGIDNELIKEVNAFDEYRGKQIPEGSRSLSLHIRFQDKEKTLTDERIDQLVELVKKKLMDTWQITMR